MNSATDIRNRVIDQLMAIKDTDYLQALSDMIDHSHIQVDAVPLTEEQKIMISMSEDDIKVGRTVENMDISSEKTPSMNEVRTSLREYDRELEEADAEIEKGEFLTHEEASKEIRSWRDRQG